MNSLSNTVIGERASNRSLAGSGISVQARRASAGENLKGRQGNRSIQGGFKESRTENDTYGQYNKLKPPMFNISQVVSS